MDLTVEQFIDGLFEEHTVDLPSDQKQVKEDEMSLPSWYDDEKFKRGQRHYWNNSFSIAQTMLVGLVSVFAVPSILRVLVGSQRSSSQYTAYKRYTSTLMHVLSWLEYDLKPGSISWKSLHTIRTRHFRAGLSSKSRGLGTVSQRDLALTQFGFFAFAVLKPNEMGIQALEPDAWEGLTHLWAVIGHMIGIEDRYNICRKTFEETYEVCQILMERVFRPCLTDVPEHFEHMAFVMLDGLKPLNPTSEPKVILYFTKYLAGVPGYIMTEEQRMDLQLKIKKQLNGKALDVGVEPTALVSKPAIKHTPAGDCKPLYYNDYAILTQIPEYKKLSMYEKYRLNALTFIHGLCTTWIGRWYFNVNYRFSLYLVKYLPYLAFFKYGIVNSYVNMFKDSPVDTTKALPNVHYYNKDIAKVQ